jgi:Na+/H+ antiporter NhaC
MQKSVRTPKAGFFQLTPFLIFVSAFLLLVKIFPQVDLSKTDDFPLLACMIAIIWALFTFKQKISFNKKIETFVSGAAQPTIMYMCFIFIASSIFSNFLGMMNGVNSAIAISFNLIPASFLLPGLFITASIFSLIIGSSMGCITVFMPVAMGFASQLGINPAMLAGIIVGGAMLGDNLSVISDTTIAATQTTGCKMSDKFKANGFLVLPAFIATIIVLAVINHNLGGSITVPTQIINTKTFIALIPYGLVLTLALLGIDVLAVLVSGSLAAGAIGILNGSFSTVTAITSIFDGFYAEKKMVAVLVLVLLIAGLAKMIEANGGIKYLLKKFSTKIKNAAHAEAAIAFLVFLINSVIAINTIAILVTGPIAKKIGDSAKIPAKRVASILDIFACVCQGIMPYAPQLLLAGALAKISSISIMPYLHYQFFIFIVAVASIVKTRFRK